MEKYPRTLHIESSAGKPNNDTSPFSEIAGKFIVIEEKMDGSMVSIDFDDGGDIHLRHRNQEVRGSEYDLLKTWAAKITDALFDLLEDRYVMYGEWLYSQHTIRYDSLPEYFLEFDIYDRKEDKFLSTLRRYQMLKTYPIRSVFVLDSWKYDRLQDVTAWAEGPSQFGIGPKEGLYIKVENEYEVLGRYKYIRKQFLDSILKSGKHWSDKPFVQNGLRP